MINVNKFIEMGLHLIHDQASVYRLCEFFYSLF
jgi:hypothetical protein